MAAKARVTLTKALTHDGRGRKFVKGQPQIIDNESDIAYYKAQSEFTVTLLKEVAKKPAKATPEPEPENDGEGEDEDEPITAESLGKMTKTELINFAATEPYNLALDNEMKKAEMIAAILDIVETEATLED